MTTRFLATIFALVLASTSASAQLVQWARSPFTGRWVGYQASTSTWDDAEARAVALHGHLVTIRDAGENAWLRLTFPRTLVELVWIGLNDVAVEGTFEWTSGEPLTFTNFAAGQPDDSVDGEDAVGIRLDTGVWNDIARASLAPSLIERVAPPSFGWSAATLVPLDVQSIGRTWPADLNLDGRTDLLATGNLSNGQGRFCSLLQQPDGSFAPIVCAPSGTSVFRTAIGDFDGDGDVDAVCGSGFVGVFLSLGDGQGGFAAPVEFLDENVRSLVALDVDHDGRDELAVAHFSGFSSVLSVFRGATSTGFAERTDLPTTQAPFDLDAADLNGDGFVDLLGTNSSTAPYAQIYLGDGTTTLTPGPTPTSATSVSESTLGDLDGDLDVDVAIVRWSGTSNNLLQVLWNDGAGGFSEGPGLANGSNYGSVVIADLDGDGHQDLVANRSGTQTLDVLRSLGGGAFAPRESLMPGGGFVTVADLRGDASPEIVVGVSLLGSASVAFLDNLAPDCDANGIDDPRDLELGLASDANLDGLLDGCQAIGTTLCAGDGTAGICPCAPTSTAGAGCANSTGRGGLLTALGVASVAADTVRFDASGLPASSSARLVQGTLAANGGNGVAFGDGLRCVAGSIVRIVQRAATNGAVAYGAGVAGDPPISTSGGLASAGGTRVYQVVYRDVVAYCTSDAFNTTNGVGLVWGP